MRDPLARRTLFKNAVANIASGASGAILAVVLPPILVRTLDRDTYSTWVLILQIGAYAGLLNFGLQTAVGRFVAHARESGDEEQRDRILSTAWAILIGAALLAGLLLAGLVWKLPTFFPRVPPTLELHARIALAWVGGSLALGLPFTVFSGIFTGLQRNEVPAAITVASRLLTAVGIAYSALAGGDLIIMAKVFACVNLVTYAVQAFVAIRWGGPFRLALSCVDGSAFRTLLDFCLALTVWNFGMLLVAGLDLVLVAWLDFPSVGAYGIAAGLLALLGGFQSAIFQVLMPASAVLEARDDQMRLGRLLLRGTRYSLILLTLASAFWVLLGPSLVGPYIGPVYAANVMRFLDVLLLAALIRLSMVPFVTVAVGAGDHRRIIGSPLAEGFSNLVASVLLGRAFGAVGIAWGTVLGGVVGVAAHLWINLPRCTRFKVGTGELLRKGLLIPGSALLPLILARAIGWGLPASNHQLDLGIRTAAVALSLVLLWRIGLDPKDRRSLRSWVGREV